MIRGIDNLDRRMDYPDTGASGNTGRSTHRINKSMVQRGRDFDQRLAEINLSREIDLMHTYQTLLDRSGLVDQKPRNFEEAFDLAAIEAATYVDYSPSLATFSFGFPQFYRFLRTAELRDGLKRGGDTLLVGSGGTISELLALYAKPPSSEDIRKFLGRVTTEEDIRSRNAIAAAPSFQGYKLDLHPGKAIALEPDPMYDLVREDQLVHFPIDNNKLRHLPLTIGEAIDDAVIPENLDTILWNRADPEIFGIEKDFDPKKVYQALTDTFIPLAGKLREGGALCVTVGKGNNPEALDDRMLLIHFLTKLLPRFQLHPVEDLVGAFEGPLMEAHYGGPALGLTAAIVAKKG